MQPGYQPAGVGPAPKSSNSGCIKALIIGIIVVVVLGIVGTVGTILLVGRAVDKTFGTADAGDYSIELGADDCTVTSFGTLEANGSITNKTNHKQAFTVTVEFSDGTTKLDDYTAYVDSLEGGQTGRFSATGIDSSEPQTVTCKVTNVSYFGQ